MWKKIVGVVFAGVTMTAVASCGLQDALDEIEKGLSEVQKFELGKKGFEQAVTQITGAVLGAAFEAAFSEPTASAPAMRALARITDVVDATVNNTITAENGGTFTVTGNIKATVDVDDQTGDGTVKFVTDLSSVWSNMKLKVEDKEYSTNGDLKVTGTMDYSREGTKETISGAITEKGKFSLDDNEYQIEIVITLSNEKLSYAGTIDGKPVNGEVLMPKEEEEEPKVEVGSCSTNFINGYDNKARNTCTDFTGSAWTADAVQRACVEGFGGIDSGIQTMFVEYSPRSCASDQIVLGTCTIADGTPDEYVINYLEHYDGGIAKAECEKNQGIWAAAQ